MMIEIIFAIFGIWIILLYIVKKKGKDHFSLIGPLIMWKTEKGKKLIYKIARKKFWKYYGNLAIIITSIAMFLTTLLVIWNVYISFKISRPISPRLIIGIPGINPVIPIGYGIITLAIAIIFHEFSHGILASFGKIKVNSLGLLFLILPIGAFVEPDEEKLMKVKRLKRARVFSAGPSTNIIIAVISLLLLVFIFCPSIEAKGGVVTISKIEGIEEWSIIKSIDGKEIKNMNEFNELSSNFKAGKFYNITFLKNNEFHNEKYLHGIIVLKTISNSPAKDKIKSGYVIYKINGNEMKNITTFEDFMDSTHVNQKINVSYYYKGNFDNISIILANKYSFSHNKKDDGKGFIGIVVADINGLVKDSSYYASLYNPFKTNFFIFISLPFRSLSPFPKELTNLYNVPVKPIFWPLLNFIYWLFWLNFALGTFNALPAIPLDGGYVFKDGIGWVIEKIKIKKAEKITSYISSIVSSLILIAIFSILLIPNLRFLFFSK